MNTVEIIKKYEGILEVVSLDQFKELHQNDVGGINKLVSRIDTVEVTDAGVLVTFEEKFPQKEIFLAFDGSGYRVSRKGKSRRFNSETIEGHKRIQIQGLPVSVERFIAIAYDVAMNQLASDYTGLACNVTDGSGNIHTASILGINPDYHFDNLEWCTKPENLVHGSVILPLYRKTGHVYRFSYTKVGIISLKLNDPAVKTWCAGNLHQVK